MNERTKTIPEGTWIRRPYPDSNAGRPSDFGWPLDGRRTSVRLERPSDGRVTSKTVLDVQNFFDVKNFFNVDFIFDVKQFFTSKTFLTSKIFLEFFLTSKTSVGEFTVQKTEGENGRLIFFNQMFDK